MTSGHFASYPIDQVIVIREERQRRELTLEDVADKARSIAKIGLIHPITIERSGRLRAGETRLEACRSLGWTHIPVQFVEDLNEAELQLLELDENIKRKNLSWQEECDAVARYHSLRSMDDADWTEAKTADALGITQASVNTKLSVQKEMQNPGSKVHAATKFSEARTITTRQSQRRAASALAILEEKPIETSSVPLLNVDFNEWAPQYTGPKFNFIHCDFPYGINADNQQQGSNVAAFGAYADSGDTYFRLLGTLRDAMDNVVAESAHLIFWFSMLHYERTINALRDMDWIVSPFPLIWHKSDNAGLLPDPLRGPRRTYETAFLGSRGDRKIVAPVANSFSSPTTKKIHMSEKPLPVLSHFFRMVIDEYSSVLDPTCGSANAIRCSSRLGARSLGLEVSTEFYNQATEHFHDDD